MAFIDQNGKWTGPGADPRQAGFLANTPAQFDVNAIPQVSIPVDKTLEQWKALLNANSGYMSWKLNAGQRADMSAASRRAALQALAVRYGGLPAGFRDVYGDIDEGISKVASENPLSVARDFHGRTAAALDFLMDGRLPLDVVKVSIYEDEQHRRFLDVEGEREPELLVPAQDTSSEAIDHTRIDGRRVRIGDLLEAGLVQPGDELVWERPKLGHTYRASVSGTGAIELPDGRRFASPSRAAIEAAGVPACDGWVVWRLPRLDGTLLDDLRRQLADDHTRADQEESADSIEARPSA